MKFLEELNKLCQELDEKYDINNGGCCYVASVIAFELEQRGLKYTFCVFDNNYHCAIKFQNTIINDIEDVDYGMCEEYFHYDSDDILNYYERYSWNSCYSRRWNLIVETIIRSRFKKYDNYGTGFYLET